MMWDVGPDGIRRPIGNWPLRAFIAVGGAKRDDDRMASRLPVDNRSSSALQSRDREEAGTVVLIARAVELSYPCSSVFIRGQYSLVEFL
jgi:hypothetical protein